MSLLCSAHSGVCILSLFLWGLAVENNFYSVMDRIPANPAGGRQGLVHMRAAFKVGFCSERHFSNWSEIWVPFSCQGHSSQELFQQIGFEIFNWFAAHQCWPVIEKMANY
jgi:hypothetical protein